LIENMHIKKGLPKRILLIRLSSIGDVVRTLPALNSLRRQFPQAHIAWAVEDKSSGLLEGHPHLDEVIKLERKEIVRALKNPLRFPECVSLLSEFAATVGRNKYDLVFDFHGIFKSGVITLLSRSPNRIGFERGSVKEFNYLFTNRKFRPSDARLPRVSRNLELIKPFVSPENLTDRALLGLTTRHREKARAFVRETFGDSRPLIAVHPGTSRQLKKWSPLRFAELCDMLADSCGARVMLTWGPGERGEAEQIRALSKSSPRVSMETESLLELAALFEMCDMMISVDSGPMHIGSVVGAPVVAIFGPTDARVNAPHWQPNRTISSNLSCSPCNEKCESAKCMEAVTPSQVLTAVQELLAERLRSGGKGANKCESQIEHPSFSSTRSAKGLKELQQRSSL
jgi:heptosyltransferase-1